MPIRNERKSYMQVDALEGTYWITHSTVTIYRDPIKNYDRYTFTYSPTAQYIRSFIDPKTNILDGRARERAETSMKKNRKNILKEIKMYDNATNYY